MSRPRAAKKGDADFCPLQLNGPAQASNWGCRNTTIDRRALMPQQKLAVLFFKLRSLLTTANFSPCNFLVIRTSFIPRNVSNVYDDDAANKFKLSSIYSCLLSFFCCGGGLSEKTKQTMWSTKSSYHPQKFATNFHLSNNFFVLPWEEKKIKI